MSEHLHAPGENAKFLFQFTTNLRNGGVGKEDIIAAHKRMENSSPRDFVSAVNMLVEKYPVDTELKKSINKMLNVYYTYLNERPTPTLSKKSFPGLIVQDNDLILEHNIQLRPLIKEIQTTPEPAQIIKDKVLTLLRELSKVDFHYQLMENIVFPFLEKNWTDHKCFQVLWSVHDDVRNELQELKNILNGNWDLKKFNRISGDLFFNIRTIIFREEKIILPAIIESNLENPLNKLLMEASEIGWAFIDPELEENETPKPEFNRVSEGDLVNFVTGQLSFKQIALVFNHLPVDITFVDENDTVKYFSTPPKRTFTRTTSVIGRKVQNCHPPESVWMVEEILEAFKKGEQSEASFWIPFKEQFVYIQYFALRDSDGVYMGTIEITQDVKEIRNLKGERRLLNWKPLNKS